MSNPERTEEILLDFVEEYIKTAEPVSSQQLLREYKYDLSSATIRNVLAELDDAGFLFQPHTSAGRIPTQKGYRFFVDKMALGTRELKRGNSIKKRNSAKDDAYSERDKLLRQIKKDVHEASRISPHLVAQLLSRRLAEHTGSLSFAALIGINQVYKEGLLHLLREPEFMNAQNIKKLLLYAEYLENHLQRLYETLDDNVNVYIGAEKDIFDKRDLCDIFVEGEAPFSFMAFTYDLPHHSHARRRGAEKGILGIIGPMRTHYSENIEFLYTIKEFFDEVE